MIFIKNDFKQLFHLHLLIKYLITFNSHLFIFQFQLLLLFIHYYFNK
jgi:hypothetical protein